jgi:hypothetical protein
MKTPHHLKALWLKGNQETIGPIESIEGQLALKFPPEIETAEEKSIGLHIKDHKNQDGRTVSFMIVEMGLPGQKMESTLEA